MALNNSTGDLGLRPYVLDRLIDLEPKISTESSNSLYVSLDDLKRAVIRDLEWLLNTRRMVTDAPTIGEESKKSVVAYGIPDISGVNIENKIEGSSLKLAVEETIRIFEPRFLDVTATVEPMSSTDRQLRVRIEAKLDLDPVPEPMIFDTVLQLGTSTIAVTEAS